MNLKVIINSLLIIIVLHLFLQNLNYEMNIGIENVVKKNNNLENFESDNSRDSLLKFLDSDGVDSNNPNPSNSNLENNSNPNFNGENNDISQFFNIYDNLNEKDLEILLKMNDYEDSQNYLEKLVHLSNNGNIKMMPMNGGSLGNDSVVGFDSLDGNYASINFNDDVPKENNIQDLRNGMSTREYN